MTTTSKERWQEVTAAEPCPISGIPTVSFPGVSSWRTVLPVLQALGPKTVRVAFDADAVKNKTVADAQQACVNELEAHGYAVEVERWAIEHNGIDDLLAAGGTPEVYAGDAAWQVVEEIARAAGVDERDSDPDANDRRNRKSQSTLLVELAEAAALWHTDGQGDAYATIDFGGHKEHWPIRSKAFKRWLARQFYLEHHKTPGTQALLDALNVLEGEAMFAGETRKVFVRVAEHASKLYLDLTDANWQAVEVDADGWR
ncbi:MAG: DUF3854 domain-containing protein, partial [Planctomycetes bacterium]|nr:DUF3854 domain-containing protein [Planctomycetota bacterium]